MSILSNLLTSAKLNFSFYSPPKPQKQNNLLIELIEPKDWDRIATKAQKWAWIAYKNASKFQAEQAKLSDCGMICAALASTICNTDLDHRASSKNIDQGRVGHKELYVCKNPTTSKICGIAIVQRNRTSLIGELLVTHPRNITDKKTPGVGSTFLNHVEKMGTERNLKNILLVNSNSSTEFYRKKGFIKINTAGYNFAKPIPPRAKL